MKHWDFTEDKTKILDAYHEELQAGNYDDIKRKYRDPATVYAFKVLDGDMLTSRSIKLAAFRHIQDLRRQNEDPDFKYIYDLKQCRLIVKFASLCPEPSTNKPLPLDLWQLAILCQVVGWRDRNNPDLARFTDIIISVARTNGKTYLSNILIAYYYLVYVNKKFNQDLGYVATTETQAKKGWRYITSTFNLLRNSQAFKRLFKNRVIVNTKTQITDNHENSLNQLTQGSQMFDAYHFNVCVIDEAASDKISVEIIRDNKDTISSGMTQTHGQIIQISTAYPDSNSYMYGDEKMNFAAMEQDYDRALDDHLCLVWQQDSADEVNQPDTWIKSNPLMDLNKVKYETMKSSLLSNRDSLMKKGQLSEFENKNLNIWLQARVDSYLPLKAINGAVSKKPPIDITGRDCYIGLDISHASDDTAVAFVFPYHDNSDGNDKFYVKEHSFVPLAHSQGNVGIKSGKDGIDYAAAEKLGYCDVMRRGRGYISDTAVYKYLRDFVDEHNLNVKYVCYDPWDKSNMVQYIVQKSDWNMLEVRQMPSQLDSPTRFFREQLDIGNIIIDDDPILQYSMKNAILKSTVAGVKIDKALQTSKIDCMDAIIDCFYIAQGQIAGLSTNLKTDNKNPLANMSSDEQDDWLNDFIKINDDSSNF